MALTGIDASRHQGTVDWGMVAAAGHSFAIIKATEGTQYRYVSWFLQTWPWLRASGLTPGAYHFLRADSNPTAQARYFVDTVGDFRGVLAVLDVETATNGTNPGIEQVRAFAAEFARLVPGHPLIVYTGRWYWRDRIGNPYGADIGPLWHSEYETTPAEVADGPEADTYGGWAHCTIWQWTSSGSCPGVSGNCDLNIFFGTPDGLTALAGGAVPTPYPEVLMPFPVIHVPGDPEGRDTFLALYPGGYERLDAQEYDAGLASGLLDEVVPVTVYQHDRAADLALRMHPAMPTSVPAEVDEAAIAAAVVAAMPGSDPAAIAAAVETIVRKVINETTLKA